MTVLTKRFNDAFAYAAAAHEHQMRKELNVPYLTHVLAVAALALEAGATEDEAIAALLHDTIEDCGGEARGDDVRARFGDAVAEIVWGCTDATKIPKPPWAGRKRAFIERLEDASSSVLLVTACDKLHNARSLVAALRRRGSAAWELFNGGKDGTLWYYRSLLDVFTRRGLDKPLLDQLTRVVAEMHGLVGSTVPLSDVRFPDG